MCLFSPAASGHSEAMPHANNLPTATCNSCGSSVLMLDQFQDYSTTRGPMNVYTVTRCDHCGQQGLLRSSAPATTAH